MKNIYKASYSDLKIPCAEQILEALIRVSGKYKKKFFLIGALARDIILETPN